MDSVSGRTLTARSSAKVNWTLRVLKRREDGYHEIESLVSPVSLYDELVFTSREEPGIELTCDRENVPTDGSNLIARAAGLLAEHAGARQGAACRLQKRIPVGGGLGGGSSNAACTLVSLNRLWGLDLADSRLSELAERLGSDVCLFLQRGSVIMRGRGERVEPLRLGWQGHVVLLFPGVPVSTAAVYQAWRPEERPHPDLGCFERQPRDAVEWMDWTFNMLERPAMQVCPQLKVLVDRLQPLAGRAVRVSGSGSTLFTAFDREQEARAFMAAVRRDVNLDSALVTPLSAGEPAVGPVSA